MPAEEYRTADLEFFPAGPDLALVYSRDTGAAAFYRPDVLDLLSSLRDFRTLDDHLRQYLADRPDVPAGPLQRELIQLCRAGFLTRRDEPPATGTANPNPIGTVGFPTRDRPALLRRAVASYAENCLRYDRQVQFVVLDDSPQPDGAARAGLAELGRRLGIRISHAGRAERAAFAAELAEAGRIPVEVLRYGCLGEPAPEEAAAESTVGANRNSMLLHAVGEPLFSADDDTVCRLAAPPRQDRQLRLVAEDDPLDTWFFADRDEAFGSVADTEQDLLGLHEEFLGQPPATVLGTAGAADWADELSPAALRRLRGRPGRILLTSNGTVGDCGWDNPYFALFAQGDSFARLTASAADYRRAGASRELAQAVRQPTITEHPQPRVAICLGLDNTEMLAPFPPTGRAEEVAFGAILTRCYRDGYGAHLPWLIRHDPEGTRQFSQQPPFLIGLGSWLPACIGRYDPGTVLDPADRLVGLGGFLSALGRWPAEQFDEFVRFTLWESMSALIAGLTERLDGAEPAPAFWAADARRFIATARRQALAPVAELYAGLGGRPALQRSLVRFGELLSWWPRIVATAAELRADGRRLAVPVDRTWAEGT
jgi:hypothetical protein